MSPSTAVRENRQYAREIKFLLPRALADQVRQWIRSRLHADPHAGGEEGDRYRITSLYFDTPHFDVFRQQGSTGRCKYRIRRYDTAPMVFLERKLRTSKLLTKRRSLVPITDLDHLQSDRIDPAWHAAWFHRRLQLRALSPICQISYLRTARVSMTPRGPIRVTLDEELRAQPQNQLAFELSSTSADVLPGRLVLELKFLMQMPALFKELVGEFRLRPQRFSKYRHTVATLQLLPQPNSTSTLTEPQPHIAYA